jgi:hypothetical protein
VLPSLPQVHIWYRSRCREGLSARGMVLCEAFACNQRRALGGDWRLLPRIGVENNLEKSLVWKSKYSGDDRGSKETTPV